MLLVCGTRNSIHGSLQTALASDKPSLERQLGQIDRDIETTDKEITKMSFLMPQARNDVISTRMIFCDYSRLTFLHTQNNLLFILFILQRPCYTV